MDALHRLDDAFLSLVDFKWLMAGIGWRVDIARLHRDALYAAECVERGLASDVPVLQQRSAELQPLLQRH